MPAALKERIIGASSQAQKTAYSFIMSPTVDRIIRYMAATQGRDKLYRIIQYAARLVYAILSKSGLGAMDYAKQISALSGVVGMSRKLFRIGKPIENLRTILKTLAGSGSEVDKLLTCGKAFGFGAWLILDTLQWLHSNHVITFPGSIPSINYYAPRFWLLGLVSSLLNNSRNLESLYRTSTMKERATVAFNKKEEVLAALQDALDLLIPLAGMGYSIDPVLVGLAGTITSILGARSIWIKL